MFSSLLVSRRRSRQAVVGPITRSAADLEVPLAVQALRSAGASVDEGCLRADMPGPPPQ